MKRDDLVKLGLDESAVDAVMKMHGTDIERHKTDLATAQSEVSGLKAQLTEAGTAIESFKALKPDELKAAADEWKIKAEKAQADAQAQVASLKYDYALDSALTGAKAKNVKAVKALLDGSILKLSEDGKIAGLDEQLTKIKTENDYLFSDTTPTPRIVTGGNSQSVLGDKMVDAARSAAGLPAPTQGK